MQIYLATISRHWNNRQHTSGIPKKADTRGALGSLQLTGLRGSFQTPAHRGEHTQRGRLPEVRKETSKLGRTWATGPRGQSTGEGGAERTPPHTSPHPP